MASNYEFKLAVCNELFEGADFAESCRALKKTGWHGIEIAPFTLAKDASSVTAERRREDAPPPEEPSMPSPSHLGR